MTTDSDCTFGVPNTIVLRFKAEAYFEAIERALYRGNDLSAFDPSVVWHVRQYCIAHDSHMLDAAELSRQRAMEHATAVVGEAIR